MVAPFFSQPGSAFKPVLIWARVILGIATEYGAQTAGSRRKPLRQRETDINPVQNDEADEKGIERRSNPPNPRAADRRELAPFAKGITGGGVIGVPGRERAGRQIGPWLTQAGFRRCWPGPRTIR